MELKEMIKVMRHFENGGEVEYKSGACITWERCSNPIWDWFNCVYRIKGQRKKITIEKWLMKDDVDNYYVVETSKIDSYTFAKKIKLLETYEVEL